MRTLVWFRGKDLRVFDHAPLADAVREGEVIPLFVLDPYFFDPRRAQELPNRMRFLLSSLGALQQEIKRRGSQLALVRGRSIEVVPELARKWRVDRVSAYRWAEPFGRERDRRVAHELAVPLDLYEGETLLPPGTLRTGGGKPYSVFTPFGRSFRSVYDGSEPCAPPRRIPPLPEGVAWPSVELPTPNALGLDSAAKVLPGGEAEGRKRMYRFLSGPAGAYATDRDRMDIAGTSRLSVDLKFGTVSMRTIWHSVREKLGRSRAAEVFSNELLWREFAYHTLWDRPDVLEQPFRPDFRDFPWRFDEDLWIAWAEGGTGYPVVDAAARQLRGEGFVHNRARMIAASFLTKHLLIDYRRGEAHYLKYLTDGDWASNNLGWQWSAGCGCDAQPYFRVFNPVTQGEKFDPEGSYVRRWIPELAQLPTRYIHSPWTAPGDALAAAGIRLGRDYPHPVVEHREARARFLGVAKSHLDRVRS